MQNKTESPWTLNRILLTTLKFTFFFAGFYVIYVQVHGGDLEQIYQIKLIEGWHKTITLPWNSQIQFLITVPLFFIGLIIYFKGLNYFKIRIKREGIEKQTILEGIWIAGVFGLIFGLFTGIFVGLLWGVVLSLIVALVITKGFGLAYGIIFGLIFTFVYGLTIGIFPAITLILIYMLIFAVILILICLFRKTPFKKIGDWLLTK